MYQKPHEPQQSWETQCAAHCYSWYSPLDKEVVKLWCHFSVPTVSPVWQCGSDLTRHCLQGKEAAPLWPLFPPQKPSLSAFQQQMGFLMQKKKLFTKAHLLISLLLKHKTLWSLLDVLYHVSSSSSCLLFNSQTELQCHWILLMKFHFIHQ